MLSALASAQSGLTFSQLWQGEVFHARKELDHLFDKAKLKVGVCENREKFSEEASEETCVAVSLIPVHATKAYTLLDTGATPNVTSLALGKHLGLKCELPEKVITVANDSRSGAVGKVVQVPVLFEEVRAKDDFVILKDVSFDLVIGRPILKRLGSVLDFCSDVVQLDCHGNETV